MPTKKPVKRKSNTKAKKNVSKSKRGGGFFRSSKPKGPLVIVPTSSGAYKIRHLPPSTDQLREYYEQKKKL